MDSSAYPLWHGRIPMGDFLRDKLSEEKFLVEGKGIRVRDSAGRWYLDARSSLWNLILGYSNDAVKEAIRRQLDELPFGTLLSYDRPPAVTVEYARALVERLPTGLRRIRLGNTGSQMTEAALLLSRFVRHVSGEAGRTAVIAFQGSYHGMGPGATALSGRLSELHKYGPLAGDVHHVPAEGGWVEAVREKTEELGIERVTAVIVEPLMGSTGIVPKPADLVRLAEFCQMHQIHFVADEISTGFGRVGDMSRCMQLDIVPDMLVLGKGMTAGYVPIGALAIRESIYDLCYQPPSGAAFLHGSTTDGHPLAMAAGLAVLSVFDREGILDNVKRMGASLHKALQAVHDKRVQAGDVDGAGLMLRLSLHEGPGKAWPPVKIEQLRLACEQHGLLVSKGLGCIWIVPPLTVTGDDCEEISSRLDAALASL